MKFILVLRFGEIFLKGKNRHFFKSILRQNLLKALEGIPSELIVYHGRYIVRTDHLDEAVCACSKIFGLTSISPSISFDKNIEAAGEAALSLVRHTENIKSFKVIVNRSDKSFPMKSPEIAYEIGGLIHMTENIPVDLHNPGHVIELEIGPDICFVSALRIAGPGGLPVGVSGSVELLLSAGIDSPVAGWMMMKRGALINATTFYSPPWVGEESLEKAQMLCKTLKKWQPNNPMKLTVVKYGEAQRILRKCRPGKLAVILYRRLMLRVAAQVAANNGAKALVTGESLGQVASQTLENMIAINQASPMLVLRPLVAFDKSDTISIAKNIDTFDISILPHQDSCTLFMPEAPETKARLVDVIRAEENVDMDAMVAELIEKSSVIEIE
ncbi:tRNA 4-thiouridine(8) synthase ThiI [Myxococcota bacterium]|nr:tRNA 4-thiouridine(8) synthase ThiI [Myxococcota bacterium]MBU1381478.1 tRNA 4-thiouridine(8) synthase ThiI [Myxococcota bacterium]MBU1497688.1 tRNA 4-thiouridine(8) synthase ThiI [Myxococcota bacterium]